MRTDFLVLVSDDSRHAVMNEPAQCLMIRNNGTQS